MEKSGLTLSLEQLASIAALGYNLYEQGKYADAQIMFEGLTAVDPNNYSGYAGLGAIALANEPPALDDAIAYLRHAATLNPNDPTVRANLGEALLRQGNLEEAAEEFEKALELDPEEEDAGANRARAILEGMETVIEEIRKMV